MKVYLVKRKERLLLFFIVSIGIYFLIHNSFCNTPRTVLSKMPYKDKQCLEAFFKEILFDESLAYVVFGTKPMSLSLFSQANPEAMNDPHNQNIKNGWHTWKKYESQFSCPQFIFRTFGDLEKDDQIFIILINKKNFINEFQQFPEEAIRLTQNNTIDEWLCDLETSSKSFSECFQNDHALKGIAFGFGKHNALTFQKNWDIYNALREKYPNEGPDFIDDEFEKSEGRVVVAGFTDTNLEAKKHIILPRFGAVPDHDETKELQKRYENDRKKIIEILAKNNFLEVIIESLTSQN